MLNGRQFGTATGLLLLPLGALAFTLHAAYFTGSRTFAAVLQPAEQLALSFQDRGALEQISVSVGQHVVAGQVLAAQDAAAAQLQLDGARAELAAAQANLQYVEAGGTQTNALGFTVQAIQAQLAGAQQAAADMASVNNLSIVQAQQSIRDAQTTLGGDQQASASLCSGGPQQTECISNSRQVAQDRQAIAQRTADYQHALAAARASADQSQRQVSLYQLDLAMAQGSPVTAAQPANQGAQLAAAQANVATAQAQVAIDQQALDSMVLRAPVSGVISEVAGSVGEIVGDSGVQKYAGPQSLVTNSSPLQLFAPTAPVPPTQGNQLSPVIRLAADGNWVVLAQVAESDVSRLHVGQAATATFNALPDTGATVTLAQIIPQAVQGSSQVEYDVVFHLAAKPKQALPGMTASVSINS
ncbi:MAG: hypothetical protein ACRENL_11860 [Candidatus Dormibacteria bacterium]